MDHRAEAEANYINTLGHELLRNVGGKISLEMEIPKILWLKNNLPEQWQKMKLLFDLPDFLTWKATNSETRSLCSLVCKWNYRASPDAKNRWDFDFFDQIGLSSLKDDHWRRIGNVVKLPGEAVGSGLSAKAAAELELWEGMPVGCSLIDAHAGALGMLGCRAPGISDDVTTRLSLICGTSTCHMALSDKGIFVEGVWGPYFSAIIADYWLNEGGQSATGKLLDHIIESHPATSQIRMKMDSKMHVQQYLTDLLQSMATKKNHADVAFLTKDYHVWPDFHGNRSPLADPSLQGMISGLSLANDEENLAVLYLATMHALTYGTRHILDELTKAGHKIETVLICGGLSQNSLFVQSQADVLGLPVLIPNERESVLLGAAILGACASGQFTNFQKAMSSMGGSGTVVKPNNISYPFHCRKYRVFQKMVKDQKEYRKIMHESM
ncbi:FGGY carbohydrate kinase domain-containing protein isoform X2 [Venturia canescens]|nr:FGGY carbohydrate kinase domain-containing protein isoform X2 [Venturia canescens]